MPNKVTIPAFGDIIGQFDMDAVVEAIWTPDTNGRKPTYGWDEFDNIKEMVWAAAEKWLSRDLVELNITGVECLTETYGLKAYMDVEAVTKGLIKPFDTYAGAKVVVDWKTREGELDDTWRHRLIDSWQWKIYGYMSGASIFIYRGISRRGSVKEIIIAVPSTNYYEVTQYIDANNDQINKLVSNGYDVWPRYMPDACNKYGRECEFKNDCDNYTMPRFTPPLGKVQSYTSLGNFNRCPELYRRYTGQDEEEGESLIGSGFHYAMAELYRQAGKVKI